MNRNELPTVAELYELEERLYNRILGILEASKPKAWMRTPELKKILGIIRQHCPVSEKYRSPSLQ